MPNDSENLEALISGPENLEYDPAVARADSILESVFGEDYGPEPSKIPATPQPYARGYTNQVEAVQRPTAQSEVTASTRRSIGSAAIDGCIMAVGLAAEVAEVAGDIVRRFRARRQK